MATYEKTISGNMAATMSLSGNIGSKQTLSGSMKMADSTVEKDYEKLVNKPKINGVELVQDKSFEALGDSVLTNFEILELMKNAGF